MRGGFDPDPLPDARNPIRFIPNYTLIMPRPRIPKPRLAIPDALISWGASLLTAIWGGFWVWFAVLHVFEGDTYAAELMPVITFAAPVLILSLLAVVFPRIGGLLLIPAAIFGAWFFDDAGARMLLATPALLLGAMLVWMGPWKRTSLARRPRLPRRGASNT